jgi:hypothetical protein
LILESEMKSLRNVVKHGKAIALASTLAVAALAVSAPASAQHVHNASHAAWHGDIAHFHEHDWAVWRGGRWNHGWHNGVYGWWWLAGGIWYTCPAPVYPYPSPWEPPVAAVATPGVVAPPATRYWYFCRSSNAYYPYVAACAEGWQQVPAQPAPAPGQP